ncbi:MAG: hypothetical protein M1821_003011 [Bathelium mastoideum]|nr:MAG: hypothetical protein M1821_003011 [Bathelium mastoideum]
MAPKHSKLSIDLGLMEGVALITLEFLFLHAVLDFKKDDYMKNNKPPCYNWAHIRDVIGALCNIVPKEVFQDCLLRPRRHEDVVALQERVGEALLRAAAEERRWKTGGSAAITSGEFQLLYGTMLYHNLRLSGVAFAKEIRKDGASKTVTEILQGLKEYYARHPLTVPTWYKMSNNAKSRRLFAVSEFVKDDLPGLALDRGAFGGFRFRLEQLAERSSVEDCINFYGLNTLKRALKEVRREVDKSKDTRGMSPSPLRNRANSLAEPKSSNMRKLVKKHIKQQKRGGSQSRGRQRKPRRPVASKSL